MAASATINLLTSRVEKGRDLMKQTLSPKSISLVFLAAFALFFSATIALAQSGRRTHKPPPAAPVAEPTPSSKSPAPKEQPRLTLVVGMIPADTFSGVPLYYYSSIMQSLTERLHSAHSLSLEVVERGFSRGEAIARAKTEKEAYVAWVELRADRYGASSGSYGNVNLSELYIEYQVLFPTTAKIKTSGSVYQRGLGKGGVVLGPGTTGRTGVAAAEYQLKQAAREAADRILSTFHLPPSDLPRT
jgi:hypothetical protein